ncbi:hypothetical protein GN244_ATG06765 [Phytophthora infestans]|uniref:Uncharacterized protein n=1 Tax=Phytophthora infestans TaxID=4787 RepID=A0A833SUL2_PHYIN|nr:hypothetical protein GN244_ATG06765 [Phytophthora infestans]
MTLIKSTVGQRESLSETIDDFAANGSSFDEIIVKLRDQFSVRVKDQAVKRDGECESKIKL